MVFRKRRMHGSQSKCSSAIITVRVQQFFFITLLYTRASCLRLHLNERLYPTTWLHGVVNKSSRTWILITLKTSSLDFVNVLILCLMNLMFLWYLKSVHAITYIRMVADCLWNTVPIILVVKIYLSLFNHRSMKIYPLFN